MSFFSENKITEPGLALLAKGQTGEPIIYTRIVIGDGYLSESDDVITEVINPRHNINVTKCVVEDGKAVIGGPLILDDDEEGFYYRELGVYAQDPDEGEILYSYGNSGDMAEWLAPGEGGITERFIELVTLIGNAPNVTAVIDSNMFATLDDLEIVRYVHPATHPASMIETDSMHRFVTDEEKSIWTAASSNNVYDSGKIILAASNWNSSQQIITISLDMLAESLIWFSLDESATPEQIFEFDRCGLWATYNGTDTGQLKITALNGAPVINIPVRVIWRKGGA